MHPAAHTCEGAAFFLEAVPVGEGRGLGQADQTFRLQRGSTTVSCPVSNGRLVSLAQSQRPHGAGACVYGHRRQGEGTDTAPPWVPTRCPFLGHRPHVSSSRPSAGRGQPSLGQDNVSSGLSTL